MSDQQWASPPLLPLLLTPHSTSHRCRPAPPPARHPSNAAPLACPQIPGVGPGAPAARFKRRRAEAAPEGGAGVGRGGGGAASGEPQRDAALACTGGERQGRLVGGGMGCKAVCTHAWGGAHLRRLAPCASRPKHFRSRHPLRWLRRSPPRHPPQPSRHSTTAGWTASHPWRAVAVPPQQPSHDGSQQRRQRVCESDERRGAAAGGWRRLGCVEGGGLGGQTWGVEGWGLGGQLASARMHCRHLCQALVSLLLSLHGEECRAAGESGRGGRWSVVAGSALPCARGPPPSPPPPPGGGVPQPVASGAV